MTIIMAPKVWTIKPTNMIATEKTPHKFELNRVTCTQKNQTINCMFPEFMSNAKSYDCHVTVKNMKEKFICRSGDITLTGSKIITPSEPYWA